MQCQGFVYAVSTSMKLELPVICKGMIAREIPLLDKFYPCPSTQEKNDMTTDILCQRFTVPMCLAIDSAYDKILHFRRIHRPLQSATVWWGNSMYNIICATSVCATFALLVRAFLKNNTDKRIQVRGTNNRWQIEYDAYTDLLAIWIAKYEESDYTCTDDGKKIYEHINWTCETKWAIRGDINIMSCMFNDDTYNEYYNAMEKLILHVCGDGTLYYRIRGTLKKHVLVGLMVPRKASVSMYHSVTSIDFTSILTPFVEPLVRLVLNWVRVYGSSPSKGKPMLTLLNDPTVCKKIASVISNLLLFNFGPEETRGVTNKNLDYFSVSLSKTIDGLKLINLS
jgi:hypothetical protein